MARMVATKAALSIRVDALADADSKSEPQAPSIGIENRAKLEARLRALEGQGDAAVVRSAFSGRSQQKFQMGGETKTYNDKADFVSTQREPVESAVQAALDAHFLASAAAFHAPPSPAAAAAVTEPGTPRGATQIPLGGGTTRAANKYVPLLARKRGDPVDVVNARWLAGPGKRRADRRAERGPVGDECADE